MGKSPAFQLYASDFDMDTASWDNEEVGIYFRLLMYQWVNKSIPSDIKRLSKIVRISTKKFEKRWQIISKKFVKKDENSLINLRMEKTRQKQDNYLKAQSNAGKKGIEIKRQKGIYPFKRRLKQPLKPKSSSSSSSSSSINKDYSQNSVEFRLSSLLYSLIKQRNPKQKKPNLQKWSKHIDLAIRIDKRTPEELEKTIRWCQENDFWKNNILSTEKLRKQFDTLFLKMNEEKEKEEDKKKNDDPYEGRL